MRPQKRQKFERRSSSASRRSMLRGAIEGREKGRAPWLGAWSSMLRGAIEGREKGRAPWLGAWSAAIFGGMHSSAQARSGRILRSRNCNVM